MLQAFFFVIVVHTLAIDAASLYQQHGSGDSGANVLDKAAKILEEKYPELAVKLFQKAADVSSVRIYIRWKSITL